MVTTDAHFSREDHDCDDEDDGSMNVIETLQSEHLLDDDILLDAEAISSVMPEDLVSADQMPINATELLRRSNPSLVKLGKQDSFLIDQEPLLRLWFVISGYE